MFTLQNIEHSVVCVLDGGEQINLALVSEKIGIEEPKGEIACRLNLTVRNVEYKGKLLIEYMRLTLMIYIFAFVDGKRYEVFRGRIWKYAGDVVKDEKFSITAYDDLMYINKSKDFFYFADGTGTKDIVTGKLPDYGIPLGRYDGPTVSQEKLVYSSKTYAAVIKEVLEKARLKTGARCAFYMREGKFYVTRYGENEVKYKFTNLNSISGEYSESMTSLVTRVLVYGKEDDDDERRVIHTVSTGDIKYGILTDIVLNDADTYVDAKAEADQRIADKGTPDESVTITTINIPTVHKGDVHYVSVGAAVGYAMVMGVSHDIKTMTMTLDMEFVKVV